MERITAALLLSQMCGLLFFCCAASETTIRISPHDLNFIEDKKMTFICETSSHEIATYWYIEDRQTKRRLQWMTPLKDNGVLRNVQQGKASLSIRIGRHFENKNLVCRGTIVGKAVYPLISVKKTIPIDAINFLTPNLELGAPIQLFCDIKAAPGVVRSVFFRNTHAAERATGHHRLNDTWTRYEFKLNARTEMKFDGYILQCIASTKHGRPETGHVLSEEKRLIVYHFNFTSNSGQNTSIPEGSTVRLSFNVTANPRPRPEQFFLVRNFSSGMNTEMDSNITIRFMGKQNFLIFAEFVPEVSGKYRLDFRSPILTRTSVAFSIDFMNLTFTSTTLPDGPILEGGHVRLSFTVNANFQLRKSQFSLIQHQPFGVAASNNTMTSLKDNVYVISVDFVPKREGNYSLLYHVQNKVWTSKSVPVEFIRVVFKDEHERRERMEPAKNSKSLPFHLCSNWRLGEDNIELHELLMKSNQSVLQTQLKLEKETGHGSLQQCYLVTTISPLTAKRRYQVRVKIENAVFKAQFISFDRRTDQLPSSDIMRLTQSIDRLNLTAIACYVFISIVSFATIFGTFLMIIYSFVKSHTEANSQNIVLSKKQ